MVDKIAIQKTVPSRSFAFYVSSVNDTMADEEMNVAYQCTDLIPVNRRLTNGRVHFTDGVIETLAFVSSTEVPGLAATIDKNDITLECMIKKSRLRSIRVGLLGDRVQIGLSITVNPERRTIDIAKEVQERVRNNVENMTGLTVAAVNVHVASIQIAQETANMH